MDRVLYPQHPLRLRLDRNISRGTGGYFCTCDWHAFHIDLGFGQGQLVGVGLARDRDLFLENLPDPKMEYGNNEYESMSDEHYVELSRYLPGFQVMPSDHEAISRNYILELSEKLYIDARVQRPLIVLQKNPITLAVYQVERYNVWAHVIVSSVNLDRLEASDAWPAQFETYYKRVFELDYAATMLFDIEL